jgi:uncharacterized protein YjdB
MKTWKQRALAPIACIAAILVACFVFTGCNNDLDPITPIPSTKPTTPSRPIVNEPVPVTGVTLAYDNGGAIPSAGIGLHEDDAPVTLTATVLPAEAANKTVFWSSNYPRVATVTDGVVTAISVGTATITVVTEDGSFRASCTVTVGRVAVTGVTLPPTPLTIELRRSAVLTPTVLPDDAANKRVKWESSDESKVTVDGNGMVTGVGLGNATVVVVTDNNKKTAYCTVIVVPVAVTSVELGETEIQLELFRSKLLTHTVLPADAANKRVTWESSDESTVTVSDGYVTAVALGSAVITVQTVDGEYEDSCTVTVFSIPVTGVELSATNIELYDKWSRRLTPTVLPEDASDQRVTWSSDHPEIATVSNGPTEDDPDAPVAGTVTAVVATGTAVITVKTVDGSFEATCNVNVVTTPTPEIPLVLIQPGDFKMGVPEDEEGVWEWMETPQHDVTLTKSFYMATYQVSQMAYKLITGDNPSYYNVEGSQYEEYMNEWPVDTVSWYDAVEFCNKMSLSEGLEPAYTITGREPATGYPITYATVTWDKTKNGYRLPTEAEWEYACRANTTTPFNFAEYNWEFEGVYEEYDWWTGEIIEYDYYAPTTPTGNWGSEYIILDWANYDGASLYGDRIGSLEGYWYGQSLPWMFFTPAGEDWGSDGLDHANQWGLYNMHGNLLEWCWDWIDEYDASSAIDPSVDDEADIAGYGYGFRVARGGSWNDYATSLRSGTRAGYTPESTVAASWFWDDNVLGFRVVRNGDGPAPSPKATPAKAVSKAAKQALKLLRQQKNTRNFDKNAVPPVDIKSLRSRRLVK